MERSNLDKYFNALPGELTLRDIEDSRDYLENLSVDGVCEWTQKNTLVADYDGRKFKTIIDYPANSNRDEAVVVLSEFATGAFPRLMAKSMVIRDMVNPEATLIIHPSSILGDSNMNLSHAERSKLYNGCLDPIVGRISSSLELSNSPNKVTIFAPSQGATSGLAFASHESTMPVSIAVVEAPNIIKRTPIELGKAFMKSGADLEGSIDANFSENSQSDFAKYIKSGSNPAELTKFIIQAIHLDNFALAKAMTSDTAIGSIEAILNKGGAVVQVWGDQDGISPANINKMISDMNEHSPGYASRVLHGLGHTATDFYALDGAIARIAANLNK